MENDFYYNFENKFRGSIEEIIGRLSSYDGLLRVIDGFYDNPKFLDIGSGRGEWLQKCKEFGFEAVGLDNNQEMVNFTKNIGFNVFHSDALEFLKNTTSDSYDVVSLFHIIEHFPNDKLITLINESKRVLNKNGLFIIETPSIDNLQVSTRTFYLDPTHINPINPDYVSYALKYSGFFDSRYFYINGSRQDEKQKNGVGLINLYKSVAQDLLIIATKSEAIHSEIFKREQSWINDMNLALDTSSLLLKYDYEIDERLLTMQNKLYDLDNRLAVSEAINNRLLEVERKFNRIHNILTRYKAYALLKVIKILIKFCTISFNKIKVFMLRFYLFKLLKILIKKIYIFILNIFDGNQGLKRSLYEVGQSDLSPSKDRYSRVYPFNPLAKQFYDSLKIKLKNRRK